MSSPTPSFPLADADLCVKCGLCLPHCPTYRLARDEGDSPRGRIALMQGLASGQLGPGPRLQQHLDGCLACRACEAVCPAQVPYGRLIDAGRTLLLSRQPRRAWGLRLLAGLLTRRGPGRGLARLLRLYQATGLQALLRRRRLLGRGRLARLESLLPVLEPLPRWPRVQAAQGASHGQVALFLGCVSEWAETRALQDGLRLLGAAGYTVHIPPGQGCCGALHLHNGLAETAARQARRNLTAFAAGHYDAILATASGCAATLREYPPQEPAAADFARRVQDIGEFLAASPGLATLRFRPLRGRVLVHEPCTLRNVLRVRGSAQRLLGRIPELEIAELAGNAYCCGAAGSLMLSEPAQADRLLQDKLEALRRQPPDWLVSSNVGCALHLAGALRRDGQTVEVLHPLTLLARQLQETAQPR